jgi:stringent starvation protein B
MRGTYPSTQSSYCVGFDLRTLPTTKGKNMKTLKTLHLEAILQYCYDRPTIEPYMTVNFTVSALLKGEIPLESNTINMGMNAIGGYTIEDNTMHLKCASNGVQIECWIPTAAIEAVYDHKTGYGQTFDVNADYVRELSESTHQEPVAKAEKKKKPSFLKIV